jgi:hypothetical protein
MITKVKENAKQELFLLVEENANIFPFLLLGTLEFLQLVSGPCDLVFQRRRPC